MSYGYVHHDRNSTKWFKLQKDLIAFDVAFFYLSEMHNNQSLKYYHENLLNFNDFTFFPIVHNLPQKFEI